MLNILSFLLQAEVPPGGLSLFILDLAERAAIDAGILKPHQITGIIVCENSTDLFRKLFCVTDYYMAEGEGLEFEFNIVNALHSTNQYRTRMEIFTRLGPDFAAELM